MTDTGLGVTGLCRIPLSQRRFRSGALYVSSIHSSNELQAIDVRYFVEDESRLIPTRQGFRIQTANLATLRKLLQTHETEIGDMELSRGANRRLLARYCDDEYGIGVDIRYFSDSSRYKGWEPRGIRLQLEDFSKLRVALLDSGIADGKIGTNIDLFGEKEIGVRVSGSRGRRKGTAGTAEETDVGTLVKSTINDALRAYIDDL